MIGHRIIPAVSPPTHTRFKMMFVAEAPPRVAAKLRSLIGMNQGMFERASPHGHARRVQHEVVGHRGLGGPADRVEIHHDGQIQPAFSRTHVGDVGDPGLVRA